MMEGGLIRRSVMVCAVLVSVLGSTLAEAQNRVLVGPALGYEFSVPLFLQRAPGAINHEPTFTGRGTSASHTIQLGLHALMPDAFSFGSVGGRVLLGVTSGWFASEPFVPGDTGGGQVVGEPRRFDVEGLAGTIQLDAQVRFHAGNALQAGVGLWTQYRFASRYTRSEYLETPMLDQFSQPEVATGESIGGHPWLIGPSASLAALVELGPGTTLLAEIGTRLDLVGLRRGLGASAMTLSPAVSLLIGPTRGETIIVEAAPLAAPALATTTSSPPSARDDSIGMRGTDIPAPTARIDIFGVSAGAVMQSVPIASADVVRRVIAPIPHVLPFAPGSDSPLEGVAMLSASEAATFESASLTGQDALVHARHGLNLLGLRMRTQPGLVVTLNGGRAAGERAELGARRVDRVRRYLTDVWGIDGRRIRAGTLEPPIAGVVIDGSQDLFALPILTQWRQRSGVLPEIALDRTINAAAGVARWRVEVSHGGARLASVSSDDAAATLDLRFIGERRPDDALLARLSVEDSLGRRVVAEDRLPLTRSDGPGTPVQRRELVELLLPLGADGELAPGSGALIASAQRTLRDGAQVTIAPIGAHDRWPAGTASARAQAVGRALLDRSASQMTALDRVTIERFNQDPAMPPAILVTISSAEDDAARR